MRAVLVGLVGAVLAVGAAEADATVFSTKAKDLSASLTVTTDQTGKTVGKYDLVAHGCIGEVSGDLVKIGPDEMLVSPSADGRSVCKIHIIRRNASVVAREDDNGDCTYFRGASCEFSQVLTRRR